MRIYDEEYTRDIFDILSSSIVENVELNIELSTAIKSLSAIEQSVIFLLYNEGLTHAEILKIWRESVDRIKKRALNKMKKKMGGISDEK